MPCLVEIGPVFLEKKIFRFRHLFSLFCNYLPWRGPSFEQTKTPFIHRSFVPSLVEIGPVVLEKKIFKFRQCIFRYFVTISPWKRLGPFI